MAPEMSTQTIDPAYVRAAASSPSTPTQAPPTHQPPQNQQQQQGTFPPTTQQQGQFQPAYFQQYPRSYGQPFQPYPQGQPVYPQQFNQYQQQFPGQQQTLPQHVQNANKAWVYTKLALHACSIVFCICAIAISFSLTSGYSDATYAFVLCTPIFFLALVWDIAEIMTWLLRKRQAGIHPGAHVGLSLIIWMGAAVVGGIESAFVAFVVEYDDDESGTCWDSETQEYRDCEDVHPYQGLKGKYVAVAVFSCLVWLVHFILFVGACVDTARRNAALRRVMVVAPPYWGHAVQGWQPMQQNTATPPQSQQQNIPLQMRGAVPPAESSVKGKEVETGESSTQPATTTQGEGLVEYYTPTSR